VSALSDAFAALKNVMLLQERLEGVQKGVDRLGADLRDLNRYAVEIDKRVARIEGVMEGYQRASTAPSQRRLLKK
jgi:hypothetical protein